jgi:hypothetical protein
MRLVLRVRGDTRGNRRWPDPQWKRTSILPLPCPLLLAMSHVIVEVVMAQRTPQQSRSKAALPPPLAAVNLHGAYLDVGPQAPDGLRQRVV